MFKRLSPAVSIVVFGYATLTFTSFQPSLAPLMAAAMGVPFPKNAVVCGMLKHYFENRYKNVFTNVVVGKS